MADSYRAQEATPDKSNKSLISEDGTTEERKIKFEPEFIRLNQRHTKILGTLNKKTTDQQLFE